MRLPLALAAAMLAGAPALAFAQTTPTTTPATTGNKMAPNASMTGAAPAAAASADQGSSASGHYSSESAATSACSGDTVVWANATSKSLWQSGTRYYGKTKHGFYACQKQALADGYHLHGSHHHKAAG